MSKRIISDILIYPIKSLGGMRLSSAKILPKGLAHDRRWMLIDDKNNFMTQRVYPQMALFKLSLESGNFIIYYSDQLIDLPFRMENKPISANIWNDNVEVYEVSQWHSDWFSKNLETNCKLVYFPENNSRPVDPGFSINDDQVSLADAYPLLIIGQASLDDLNLRLKSPFPMNRFRPNIVFTGGEPYEEDSWRNFRIGQNRFAAVKPCSRCAITTVNQDTGEKGTEPLATLAAYRMQNNKVYFGQNLVPLISLNQTEIAEGDEIVLE
jgi:uncharacterized protein YcbX